MARTQMCALLVRARFASLINKFFYEPAATLVINTALTILNYLDSQLKMT